MYLIFIIIIIYNNKNENNNKIEIIDGNYFDIKLFYNNKKSFFYVIILYKIISIIKNFIIGNFNIILKFLIYNRKEFKNRKKKNKESRNYLVLIFKCLII